MSGLTFTNITRINSTQWRYAWSSGLPPFTVYKGGYEVDTTNNAYYDCYTNGGDEPPEIEVIDADSDEVPDQLTYPPRLLLQWRQVANAISYRVQEYVDGEWTTRAQVSDSNSGYYQFQTDLLADDTTHQWRVLGMDRNGNTGLTAEITRKLVRNPPAPTVSVSCSSGTVRVSDAS